MSNLVRTGVRPLFEVEFSPWLRRVAAVLLSLFVIAPLVALFAPWQQNISGAGQVAAFTPVDGFNCKGGAAGVGGAMSRIERALGVLELCIKGICAALTLPVDRAGQHQRICRTPGVQKGGRPLGNIRPCRFAKQFDRVRSDRYGGLGDHPTLFDAHPIALPGAQRHTAIPRG